ncbi:MAG: glycoside hydrolase family 99-like domain-containing protein [Bacteroidetes bacterium]|nr:glycoside hydrolase family 99-like domain-containing protein [Bacteroidota bacterium]
MNEIKFLAYYLPQYHSVSENDEWWGKGFTEWPNVRNSQPLFMGHNQPRFYSDLGYYNLTSRN